MRWLSALWNKISGEKFALPLNDENGETTSVRDRTLVYPHGKIVSPNPPLYATTSKEVAERMWIGWINNPPPRADDEE